MHIIDWIVLAITLVGIIVYGLFKSRHSKNVDGYFLDDRNMSWSLILLSIMGTQASAITFLSAPGQAYSDGMRFIQNYFGLPMATIVISLVFVPIYHRLKIYTAYEFLERRFDVRVRVFTAFLFLLGRGLSTGISIYAPAIIVSTILGWNIYLTILVVGGLLIIYSVYGGLKSIAYTQRLQFGIIMIGMVLVAVLAQSQMPPSYSIVDSLWLGGEAGKMNMITTGTKHGWFDFTDRYNLWSGIVGGFFLSLSYFGTDQSQVSRYLGGKGERQIHLGLLLNGLIKIPMQFFLLLIGILIFAFFQVKQPPLFFNQTLVNQAKTTSYADTLAILENKHAVNFSRLAKLRIERPANTNDSIKSLINKDQEFRNAYRAIIHKAIPSAEATDTNYILLYFVTRHMPVGLVGLIIAVIILAAWGSISAALHAMAGTTLIDLHQTINPNIQPEHLYRFSRLYTLLWGLFCMLVAMFATNMGSLIEAVNILGSLFYGVILGIFLVAFFLPKVKAPSVFWGSILAEIGVIVVYYVEIVSFLWLNVIGALFVLILSLIAHFVLSSKTLFKF